MGVSYSNLIKWNMTKVTGNNWLTGIEWNVSTIDPTLDIYKGEVNVGDNGFYGIRAFPFPAANVIVLRTHNAMKIMEGWDYTTGKRLWRNTNTVADIGVNDADGGPNGPIILLDGATQSFVAYDVKTGQEMWKSKMGDLPWGMVPNYCYAIHNSTFYHGSYDGHVYAVDLATGKRLWQSDYTGDEPESLYGHQPFNGRAVGADGVLFFSTDTVYQLMPRTRFHVLAAIDESTGKFLWKLPIGAKPRSIAYGYLVATDGENGIQYCIGKGKTATSITAPLTTVPSGNAVLIQGTIMDMSPGKPNTPAVSDANMDEWMDYLYGQNATLLNNPPKPDGVTVRLSAKAADGSIVDIGTVTSDSGGMYKKTWTPPVEGEYTVYATFDGSNSYWGSYAQTALSITKATETPDTTQEVLVPDYTIAIIGVGLAVIIAVVVATILLYRKK
jgi:outer membrane protein assembly factor BamB